MLLVELDRGDVRQAMKEVDMAVGGVDQGHEAIPLPAVQGVIHTLRQDPVREQCLVHVHALARIHLTQGTQEVGAGVLQ